MRGGCNSIFSLFGIAIRFLIKAEHAYTVSAKQTARAINSIGSISHPHHKIKIIYLIKFKAVETSD